MVHVCGSKEGCFEPSRSVKVGMVQIGVFKLRHSNTGVAEVGTYERRAGELSSDKIRSYASAVFCAHGKCFDMPMHVRTRALCACTLFSLKGSFLSLLTTYYLLLTTYYLLHSSPSKGAFC